MREATPTGMSSHVMHPPPPRAQERELAGTKDQEELFMEALTAKDHVVVDLTNQLFQLEHKGQVLAKYVTPGMSHDIPGVSHDTPAGRVT